MGDSKAEAGQLSPASHAAMFAHKNMRNPCRAALENRHVRGASKSTVNRLWANLSHDYTKEFDLSSVRLAWFLALTR